MELCRGSDAEVGAADPRMAAYFDGQHHPREALSARVGYVAIEGGTVIGYVAGHLTRRYGCEGEVQYLYVSPAHRRSGVGRELIVLLARWFVRNGGRHVCVDVNEDSSGARPFYLSLGAKELRPHWMHWQDVSVIVKSISEQ